MKTTNFFKSFMAAAVAVVAMNAFVSCEDMNKEGDEPIDYSLALADNEDAEITIAWDANKPFEIALNTNVPKDKLSVTFVTDQTWCDASLNETGTSVVVTPGGEPSEEAQTAEFTVAADVEGVEPVTFTVTREAIVYTIDIESTDFVKSEYMTSAEVSAQGGTVSFVVNTNASAWYAAASYGELDGDWYSFSATTGVTGTTVTITIEPNTGSTMRNLSFTVTTDTEDLMAPNINMNINQLPAVATSAKLYYYNSDTEERGAEISSGSELNATESPEFVVEANGGVDFKFVTTGTNDVVVGDATDYEADYWVLLSADQIYGENRSIVGMYYTLSADTPGTDVCDLVVYASGTTTELFRVKVTNAE